MNWGYKIALVIAIFLAGMFFMVYTSYQQSVPMIDKDYYEKEIAYQEIINASKKYNALSDDSLIILSGDSMFWNFHENTTGNGAKGKIEFIKTDNESHDKTLSFTCNDNRAYVLPKSIVSSGTYKVRTRWMYNQNEYYREQNITLIP